jgi:excisionase family DNA binding protein
MSSDPLLWNLEETARQLGRVSVRTVRRLINSGAIDAQRVGRRVMVKVASVRAFVDQENGAAHNSYCAGKAVQQEESTCRESANVTRTVSSRVPTRRTGGRASRTAAAEQLADLLGCAATKTPIRSRPRP